MGSSSWLSKGGSAAGKGLRGPIASPQSRAERCPACPPLPRGGGWGDVHPKYSQLSPLNGCLGVPIPTHDVGVEPQGVGIWVKPVEIREGGGTLRGLQDPRVVCPTGWDAPVPAVSLCPSPSRHGRPHLVCHLRHGSHRAQQADLRAVLRGHPEAPIVRWHPRVQRLPAPAARPIPGGDPEEVGGSRREEEGRSSSSCMVPQHGDVPWGHATLHLGCSARCTHLWGRC